MLGGGKTATKFVTWSYRAQVARSTLHSVDLDPILKVSMPLSPQNHSFVLLRVLNTEQQIPTSFSASAYTKWTSLRILVMLLCVLV